MPIYSATPLAEARNPEIHQTLSRSNAALPALLTTVSRSRCRQVWLGCIALMLILPPCSALGQTSAPGSDPEALSLAAKAIVALTGGQKINDVTLIGNATWSAGQGETGTATLKALGTGESRVDLSLPDGTRTVIRDASTGVPEGQWSNPDGKSGLVAAHNTMTDAAWFFPAFGSLAGGSSTALTYVGLETRNGESVQHLRTCICQPQSSAGALLTSQQLSTMEFYLDATSFLPVAITFNEHPDNNAYVNLPVEIDFSDYQTISGAQVAMHITKVRNGAALLDVSLTGAIFNSGLSLSEFSISQEAN